MEIELAGQLAMFIRSILLGGVLGLLYDLLRTLRVLGGRVWGGILDGVYCVLSVSALFFFVMAGDGELRLFFLAGALGGAVLFFCLLSGILRPLWAFWLQILLSPFLLARDAGKKCGRSAEKLLFRGKNWIKIELVRRRERWKKKETEGGERRWAGRLRHRRRGSGDRRNSPKAE